MNLTDILAQAGGIDSMAKELGIPPRWPGKAPTRCFPRSSAASRNRHNRAVAVPKDLADSADFSASWARRPARLGPRIAAHPGQPGQ